MQASDSIEEQPAGEECPLCGTVALLVDGPDGLSICPSCLADTGSHLVPMPATVRDQASFFAAAASELYIGRGEVLDRLAPLAKAAPGGRLSWGPACTPAEALKRWEAIQVAPPEAQAPLLGATS